jgi:muconolactone delta-isomerase
MRFMLKLTLNRSTSEEIIARIPAEQKRGKELTQQGIQQAVYVAADRSAVWTVWNCDSQETLTEVTRTLPLFEFWNIEVTRLAEDDY